MYLIRFNTHTTLNTDLANAWHPLKKLGSRVGAPNVWYSEEIALFPQPLNPHVLPGEDGEVSAMGWGPAMEERGG